MGDLIDGAPGPTYPGTFEEQRASLLADIQAYIDGLTGPGVYVARYARSVDAQALVHQLRHGKKH